MFRITVSTALLCLLLTLTATAEPDWKVLEPDDGSFSIVLPGATEHATSSADTFLGPIVCHSFYVSDAEATCTVVYTDLPRTVRFLAGKERIYKEARNEVLRRTKASLKTYEALESRAQSGRLLTYSGPDKVGRTEMFLVQNRLYVIDVFSAPSSKPEASSRIFDSFKLTKSVAAR
jgi:hypothetical protein